MYYPCSENKGADQLHGYREADLRLCFRICKKPVFSRRGSNCPIISMVKHRLTACLLRIDILYHINNLCLVFRLDLSKINWTIILSYFYSIISIHVSWPQSIYFIADMPIGQDVLFLFLKANLRNRRCYLIRHPLNSRH